MYRDLCYLPFVFKNDDNDVEYQTSSLIFIKSETLLMNWTELWTLRFITHPSSSRSPCFSVPLGSSSCVFSSLVFSSLRTFAWVWLESMSMQNHLCVVQLSGPCVGAHGGCAGACEVQLKWKGYGGKRVWLATHLPWWSWLLYKWRASGTTTWLY